jgi:hypothetical protein
MNFSYGRMYDNSRMGMQTGQPFMGQPQRSPQMSAPMQMPQQAPQANYSAIAQQMAPQAPKQPLMGYGIRQPRQGIA